MTIALISHPDCLLHNPGVGHPECPERLLAISRALISSGLDAELLHEEAPLATAEQLQSVHDRQYIDSLFHLNEIVSDQKLIKIDPDTIMNQHTLSAALHAAGSVIRAVDLVLSKKVNAAFCNIRPPGHHAESKTAMGFCFFNNVAVGVAHALTEYRLKRIAIIDFDVHRANGTEEIFYKNKKVLICSSYEDFLYPYAEGELHAKNIIRIPLPSGATGREFRAEWVQHGFDKIMDFRPELIFISAGFDAQEEDNLSTLNLLTPDYLWITRQIKQIADDCCQGRIISVLEGGYALNALGAAVVAHIQALAG
jgi:acetoin utilization deacetylase AcuC-like enzyme